MLKAIRFLIKCIESISPSLAARLVIFLSSRPMRYSWPERERMQIEQAERIHYTGSKGTDNVAWSWGEGPIVLLVHGWASRGSQMATMAMAIAEAGFRAVAIDLTAHGASGGKIVGFKNISEDIALLAKQLGEIHAVVGHSAGGVMAMGSRELAGMRAHCYAVLGSPVAPYPALAQIKKMLKVSDKTLEYCKKRFASQLGSTWNELEKGRAFFNGDAPLLLIFDADDKEVPISQGEKIHSLWKDSELLITNGLGHVKLMWNPQVIEAVIKFLKANLDASMAASEMR